MEYASAVRLSSGLLFRVILMLCFGSGDGESGNGDESAEKNTVSIVFGGDVDFSRLIQYLHEKRNCSYVETMRGVREEFKSADYTLINLETTVQKGKANKSRKTNEHAMTVLHSDEAVLPAIKINGVDIVGLANNHLLDFMEEGVNETVDLAKEYNLSPFGVVFGKDNYKKQEPLILLKNGLKIGILGYCDIQLCHTLLKGQVAGPALSKVSNVIAEAESLRKDHGCDIVVLFMHWGIEFNIVPAIGNIGFIREIMQGTKIDAFVGGHPHVKQPHFYVNDTLVVTSLGNLVFTPYGFANFNFNENCRNGSSSFDIINERLWYKQMDVIESATMKGKLLRIVFDKNGVVREKTKYINTKISKTEKHCLVVGKDEGAEWRTVCNKEDPECSGTSSCNYIECDGRIILPDKAGRKPYMAPIRD